MVNLSNADLIGVDLSGMQLIYREFKNAELSNAKLVNADLRFTVLDGAILSNADLENADLKNATLKNANFENANLKGADLRTANLEGVNLKNANLEGVIIDNTTTITTQQRKLIVEFNGTALMKNLNLALKEFNESVEKLSDSKNSQSRQFYNMTVQYPEIKNKLNEFFDNAIQTHRDMYGFNEDFEDIISNMSIMKEEITRAFDKRIGEESVLLKLDSMKISRTRNIDVNKA